MRFDSRNTNCGLSVSMKIESGFKALHLIPSASPQIVGADSISAREKSLQINEIGVISFAGGYGIRPYGLS